MALSVDDYIKELKNSRQLDIDRAAIQLSSSAIMYLESEINFTDGLISLLEELKERRTIMAAFTKAVKQEREKNNENS